MDKPVKHLQLCYLSSRRLQYGQFTLSVLLSLLEITHLHHELLNQVTLRSANLMGPPTARKACTIEIWTLICLGCLALQIFEYAVCLNNDNLCSYDMLQLYLSSEAERQSHEEPQLVVIMDKFKLQSTVIYLTSQVFFF